MADSLDDCLPKNSGNSSAFPLIEKRPHADGHCEIARLGMTLKQYTAIEMMKALIGTTKCETASIAFDIRDSLVEDAVILAEALLKRLEQVK